MQTHIPTLIDEPSHAQRWRGEEKRGSTNSSQAHNKNHMTKINRRRQPPHAAPGTIHPIVPHGSRLLGLLPSTSLPYAKNSTTQPARRDKHHRPQQRHSLSTEHLTSRRPRKHSPTRISARYIDETPAVDSAKAHHDTTRICGIHPTKKHYRKNPS